MRNFALNPSFSIPGLSVRMPKKVAEALLAEMIKVYSKASDPDHAKLREIIHKNVTVPETVGGIEKANPGQIRRALESDWIEKPILSRAILDVWSNRHKEVYDLCKAVMGKPSSQMHELTRLIRNSVDCADPVVLTGIMGTIQENHPSIKSSVDIWLAAAIALSDVVSPGREPGITKGPDMTASPSSDSIVIKPEILDEWEDILCRIRSIPPDDQRWQTFEAFLQAAKVIAGHQQKALERLQSERQIQSVLERCLPLIGEQAVYFEIPGIKCLEPGNVTDDRVSEASQAVEELHDKLEKFLSDKDILNRTQRVNAEDQILQAYRETLSFFSGSPAATPAGIEQDAAAGSAAEVEEAAATEEGGEGEQNTAIAPDIDSDDDQINRIAESDGSQPEELLASQAADVERLPMVPMDTEQAAAELSEAGIQADEETDAREEDEGATITGDVTVPTATDGIEPAGSVADNLTISADPSFVDVVDEKKEDTGTRDGASEIEPAGDPGTDEEPFLIPGGPLPAVSAVEANEELLRRLKTHDIAAAYWLAWANEQLGDESSFPAWLLAAMYGAICSISLWPEQSTAFQESVAEVVQPNTRDFETLNSMALAGLAAGLYFNLTESTGRWMSWLEAPLSGEFPGLSKMIDMIVENSHRGVVLDPLMLQLMWNRDEVDSRAKELSDRVDAWLRQASEKGARLVRAAKVWQEMVRPGHGQLHKWLDLVAHDQRTKASEVNDQLVTWSDRGKVSLMIHQLDQQLSGRRSRPIDGEARDQIIGWVADICALAQEWCNTVSSLRDLQEGKTWTYDQVRNLCESLQPLVKQATTEISGAATSESDPLRRVSLDLIEQILVGIKGMITPDQKKAFNDWPAMPSSRQEHLNLRTLLMHSLLLYPELELDAVDMLSADKATDVRNAIKTIQNRTVEEALQGWVNLHDYRFVEIFLDRVSNAEAWEIRIREALRQDVQKLENRETAETLIAIEQALLETLIAEGEHTEYISRVESVRKQVRQPDFNAGRRISVRQLSNRLLEIREQLKAKRSSRLANQQQHWEVLRVRLSEMSQDSEGSLRLDAALREKIERAVDKSFREGDLRAAGEYLAHLQASIALQPVPKLPEEAVFDSIQDDNPRLLADFINRLPDYAQMVKPRGELTWSQIIDEVKRANSTLLDIPSGSLPAPRRQEAARAMEAWRFLKSSPYENEGKLLPHVAVLMQYLGFEMTSPSPVSVGELPPGMRDYQLWRVSASAGVFAPVAQFGSQRKGRYQVLGAWNRPGMETLGAQVSALMKKTGDEPTIVFYFHVLTPEQRRQLLAVTHHNKLPILVIDEATILHLARERENRLRVMFASNLPFTALNPYFPAAAGLVPPEIYMGRSDLVRDLMNPQGPVIIYGGRQLGKSALLRQVEREFNHPKDGQLVLYEDIKLVGAVGSDKLDYQTDLRDRLAPKFVALGLLDSSSVAKDIGAILSQVEQKVKNKNVQVRLLLDETDNFLNADALHNFPVVQKLKSVMEQTDHAFKFILAGLHNVQRFGRIPNHPLAHLGDPIQIGPLPPRPARDLLVEPLHVLGFHFGNDLSHEDTSLPLHILSYTNRHPGLIQYFGSALVKHMLEKHQQPTQPPLCITRADVEQVYRKKEVRDKICERFNLTLDLDPRYTAITLVMILEQWDDQNGFDRLYSAQLLRERAAAWWADAFGEEAITPEGFKGILEEMVGLGVLAVGQDENSFRLRSPNLVYLMGTQEEIWDRMERLAGSVPPGQSALDSHHARLETQGFSPFTFGQERVLANPRSGVALIFGSDANGFGSVKEALRRLLPEKNRFCPVGIAARGAPAVVQQLKQNVSEHAKTGLLIAYREMQGSPDKMAEEVQAAIQFCAQTKNPTLKVCFTFDPQAAWQWFQLPEKQREQIEERALVIGLQCWDRIGVQQWLEMAETTEGSEILVPDRLLTRVLEATGGWMTLVEAYIAQCRNKEPGTAMDLFQQSLRMENSLLVGQFVDDLGIDEALPRELIHVLRNPQLKQFINEDPVEFLSLVEMELGELSRSVVKNTVQYLQRLGIIICEPNPQLDAVVGRYWNAG